MPKLEDKTTYFELDGVPYPKNKCRAVVHDTHIGLAEVGSGGKEGGKVNWVSPSIFSEWTDQADTPYASKDDLLTAIGTICFS